MSVIEEAPITTEPIALPTYREKGPHDEVLDYTNEIRHSLGLPPLTKLIPGDPEDATQCVIARSVVAGLDDVVPEVDYEPGKVNISIASGGSTFFHREENNPKISRWLERYDNCEFKELIDGYEEDCEY